MINVMKKGSFTGSKTFNTEKELQEFFKNNNKEDWVVLGSNIRMREEEARKAKKKEAMKSCIEFMLAFDVADDLDDMIECGDAILIDSNSRYDYYAVNIGIFVSRSKKQGIVKNVSFYWNEDSNNFYTSINYKKYAAAKLMYETFNEKLEDGVVIKFVDRDRTNLSVDNLYHGDKYEHIMSLRY